MVIGNGSIAKVFKQEFGNDDSVIIFASGVSNSNEKNLSEYQRETILLQNTLTKFPEKKIVFR